MPLQRGVVFRYIPFVHPVEHFDTVAADFDAEDFDTQKRLYGELESTVAQHLEVYPRTHLVPRQIEVDIQPCRQRLEPECLFFHQRENLLVASSCFGFCCCPCLFGRTATGKDKQREAEEKGNLFIRHTGFPPPRYRFVPRFYGLMFRLFSPSLWLSSTVRRLFPSLRS